MRTSGPVKRVEPLIQATGYQSYQLRLVISCQLDPAETYLVDSELLRLIWSPHLKVRKILDATEITSLSITIWTTGRQDLTPYHFHGPDIFFWDGMVFVVEVNKPLFGR